MYSIQFPNGNYITDDQNVVIERLKDGYNVRKIRFYRQAWEDALPCRLVKIGDVYTIQII